MILVINECTADSYDISSCFKRMRIVFPSVDAHLLRSVKALWLDPLPRLLAEAKARGESVREKERALERCKNAASVDEFLSWSFPFASKEKNQVGPRLKDAAAFFELHNPMNHVSDVLVPILALNSMDDVVCLAESIPISDVASWPNFALLLTKYGSHIAYEVSLTSRTSWMHRITLEWLEAARDSA